MKKEKKKEKELIFIQYTKTFNYFLMHQKLQEDLQLMADLGLEAYRFSVSWSRLIPGMLDFMLLTEEKKQNTHESINLIGTI